MHEIFLKRAIDLARKGKYLTKPNPMVGCVIVKDNEVIAEGHHTVSYTHLRAHETQ